MRICKKLFRVQHQRCIGAMEVVLLQNRLIEAETAAQALQMAMHAQGQPVLEIDICSEDLALADRSDPSKWFDFWKAELDLHWLAGSEADAVAS